jgi:hypothetical protein
MSKSVVLSLALVLALAGCGGKDEAGNEKASIGDAISAVSKLDDVADASKNMEKHMEELKKLTPLTNEQLKSVLPDSMGGVARSSFEISSAVGLHLADAKYEKDTQSIGLQVNDGSGEMGASMVAMVELATAMGGETETQTGYTKLVAIGNAKGSEKQDRSDANNVTNEVTLVVANRYVLIVNSRGATDMEALKTMIKDSKIIDKLESLK